MGRYIGRIRALVAGLVAAVVLAFLHGPAGLSLGDGGIVASAEVAPWLPHPAHNASEGSSSSGAEGAALRSFREGHRDFARVSLANRSHQAATDVVLEFSQIPAPTVMLLTSDAQASVKTTQTTRMVVPDIPPGETTILAIWSAAELDDAPGVGIVTGRSSLGNFEVTISSCCTVSPTVETGWEVFTYGWFPKLSILLGLALLAVVAAGFVFWRKYAASLLGDPEYYARERNRHRLNPRFVARLPADDPMSQPRGQS